MFHISKARIKEDLKTVRDLFQEYAKCLGIDLSFQNFDQELANPFERYAPPKGCLLIAKNNLRIVGCVGLREFSDKICEMKRLYVKKPFRSSGVGRLLAEAVITEARLMGYSRMKLDTLPSMKEAAALYSSLGFVETSSYYRNPIEGTIFMELNLAI